MVGRGVAGGVGKTNMHVIAFDTETICFSAADMAPTVVCVSYSNGDVSGLVHHNDALPWLRALFEYALANRVTLVGHNVAYDFACIVHTWPELTDLVWALYDNELVADTIVRQKLSDLARGRYRGFRTEDGFFVSLRYDLASVAQRHLGKKRDKGEDTWRKRYEELLPYPVTFGQKTPGPTLLMTPLTLSMCTGCRRKRQRPSTTVPISSLTSMPKPVPIGGYT